MTSYAQPTAENLLGNFTLEDLLTYQLKDPRTEAQRQAQEQRGQDAAWVYSQPQGKRLIDALVEETFQKPVWLAQAGLPMEQVAMLGCHHEGKNDIVKELLKWVAIGRGDFLKPKENT